MNKEKGKAADAQAYILMGDLAHQASRDRTSSFKQALASGDCKTVTIADEQSAAWTRTNAMDMTTNWNHRYRENMDRLKSGDLDEVSAVIKALMHRDSTRGLSNGERKMLHIAKQILVSEIVLAEDVEYPEAEGRVNAAMLLKESD